MGLEEAVQAFVPSPGATWQSQKTPLELAREQLAPGRELGARVSALRLLARRRCPLTMGREELIGTADVEALAPDVLGCLADDQWRVRQAALDTLRVWGLQAMGPAAVEEAAAKAKAEREAEARRNTPMRTYAEAHHKQRIQSQEANITAIVAGQKWARKGRASLQRRKPPPAPTVDATMAGLRLNPRGGSGRTQELLVTCPRNRRAGDTLTVITADGSALDVPIPYGVMPGMEFSVVVELPSVESVVLSRRIARRFRVSSAKQRARLRSLVSQMDNNADGMLSRAELSSHLETDKELVAMLKLSGRTPASVMRTLGTRGFISIDDFLKEVGPRATAAVPELVFQP